jgi:hypothetical protein
MSYNYICLRKIVVFCSVRNPTDSTTKYTKNLKTVHSRKKKERMKVKLMATSDPELKASLRRKKAAEMKRYRQRK